MPADSSLSHGSLHLSFQNVLRTISPTLHASLHPHMPSLIPFPHSHSSISFLIKLFHDDFLTPTKSFPPAHKLEPSTHILTPNLTSLMMLFISWSQPCPCRFCHPNWVVNFLKPKFHSFISLFSKYVFTLFYLTWHFYLPGDWVWASTVPGPVLMVFKLFFFICFWETETECD